MPKSSSLLRVRRLPFNSLSVLMMVLESLRVEHLHPLLVVLKVVDVPGPQRRLPPDNSPFVALLVGVRLAKSVVPQPTFCRTVVR